MDTTATHTGLPEGIDPVVFEVMRNALANITEEMALTVRRAAYSTNIKTRADFSCAFFDAELRCIVQSFAQPPHLVSMSNVLPVAIREFGAENLSPGDALLVNDPHRGASHLNDITCISPVFAGDRLVGYLANMAHHVDVGGASAASLGANREIFQEGIIISPLRIVHRGVYLADVFQCLLGNVRAPRETEGDLRAQVSANAIGARRVVQLVERHGAGTLARFFDQLIDYTDRWTAAEIAALPQGSWMAEGFRDDDGFTDTPVRIVLKVTIGDGCVTLDATGSDPQRPSPLNATRGITACAIVFVTRCLMSAGLPVNSGFLNRIRVTGPDGTCLTAVRPAAVVGGWEMGQRIAELTWLALHPAMPERVPAAGKGVIVNLGIAGQDPRKDEFFCYMETIAGGNGARPGMDGPDAVQTSLHNTENAPIEEVELNYPFRIKRYELIEDSGGVGQYRGGLGIRRDFEFPYAPMAFTILSDGRIFPPWGLEGGGDARCARFVLDPEGAARNLPSKITVEVPRGGVLRVETPGGGGHGPAAKRAPEAARADLRDGKISAATVARSYPHAKSDVLQEPEE